MDNLRTPYTHEEKLRNIHQGLVKMLLSWGSKEQATLANRNGDHVRIEDWIVGFGIGVRNSSNSRINEQVIRVYVEDENRFSEEEVRQLIRSSTMKPQILYDEVGITTIPMGRATIYHHSEKQYLPNLPGGAVVLHQNSSCCGTLGAWVWDDANNPYMLGCWHVFAGAQDPPSNREIAHPNADDRVIVGNLVSYIAPSLTATDMEPFTVDAALASPVNGVVPERGILDLGPVGRAVTPTEVGTPVNKSGGYSHMTTGTIEDFNVVVSIDYRDGSGAIIGRPYVNCWSVEPNGGADPFSIPGDSGSLVTDNHNNGVGIVLGGSVLREGRRLRHQTFVMPIQTIFDEFSEQFGTNLRFDPSQILG